MARIPTGSTLFSGAGHFETLPPNIQDMLQSLEAIGFNLSEHDMRFVHDDWESPSWRLGLGLGSVDGRDGSHPVYVLSKRRQGIP